MAMDIAYDVDLIRAVDAFCKDNNVEVPAMLAVVVVESGGRTSALDDNGDKAPLIRFEGHYYFRRLNGAERDEAVKAGLASPKVGAIKNPSSQAGRWRLFRAASAINRQAAIESMSYGVGQVMGANWKSLGYRSAEDFFSRVTKGTGGQIDAMCRFIEKNGLVDELQRLDFAAFKRGYNGPGKNNYAKQMARAYKTLSGQAPVSKAKGMLRMGSKGARVRDLQTLLNRAGFPVKVDGDYGKATRDAVKAFQRRYSVEVDGVVGPATQRALEQFRQGADDPTGETPIKDVPEVKDAAKGMGVIALITAARDQLAEGASWLLGLDFETAQTIASVTMATTAAIGAGLALYGLYGWWKGRQTDEGDVHA